MDTSDDAMSVLPPELFVAILLELDPADKAPASLVCHRWHDVLESGEWHQRVFMRHFAPFVGQSALRDPLFMHDLVPDAGSPSKLNDAFVDACDRGDHATMLRIMWPFRYVNHTSLWRGHYGPHGWEYVSITQHGFELRGVKLTGDPNVPAGNETFAMRMQCDLRCGAGTIQLADHGFVNPRRGDAEILFDGPDAATLYWRLPNSTLVIPTEFVRCFTPVAVVVRLLTRLPINHLGNVDNAALFDIPVLLALLAAASGATLRTVRVQGCVSDPTVERWALYADLVVGDEIIRAVDTNLVAGSGTSIVGWTTNVPSDACAPSSYVTFNRKATGPDCTQVTPDFSTSATFLKGGYFCNDPTSSQKDTVGGSVLVAQLALQRNALASNCDLPSASGNINIIVNRVRQFTSQVCIGSGCNQPATLCTNNGTAGVLVPVVRQSATAAAPVPTVTYAFVGTSATIPVVDVNSILASQLPAVAADALLTITSGTNVATAIASVTPRAVLGAPRTRSVLFVTAQSLCPQTSLQYTVSGQRTINVAQYMAAHGITIAPSFATITLSNTSGSCMDLYTAARNAAAGGTAADHIVLILPNANTACGALSFTSGCATGACFVATSTCDTIDRIAHGLLRNLGLGSSDAADGSYGGDRACMLGRADGAEGLHRRGINGAHYTRLGLVNATQLADSVATNLVLGALYTSGASVVRLSPSNVYLSFRALSHPGVDRQANALQNVTGRTSVHQLQADGVTTRFLGSVGNGQTATFAGVTVRQVRSSANTATLVLNNGAPPPPQEAETIPAAATIALDYSAFAAMSDGSGDGPANVAYSNVSSLRLGVNGNDKQPFVFVRFSAVPINQLSRIDRATLYLTADQRQFVASRGVLRVEAAIELVDSATHALTGNILSTDWSAVRIVTPLSADLWLHDEMALDVGDLLQTIVDRSGWPQYGSFLVRLRNDPNAPFSQLVPSRNAFSGTVCPGYRCGPRMEITYSARSTSSGRTYVAASQAPTTPPLAQVLAPDDGQVQTLNVTAPALRKRQLGTRAIGAALQRFYTFNVGNLVNGTLSMRARVTGTEAFQAYVQLYSNWVALNGLLFNSSSAALETKSAPVSPLAVRDGALIVRIADVGQAAPGQSSTLFLDYLALQVTQVNVDCQLGAAPPAYGQCSCTTGLRCRTRTVVTAAQGAGAACPSLLECVACTPAPCATITASLNVSTFVSVDGAQQWNANINSTAARELQFATPSGVVKLGVRGQAVSTVGPYYVGGQWSMSANPLPTGTSACRIVSVQLLCNTGDARASIELAGSQGPLECKNARVPEARPTTASFVLECS